MITRYKKYNWWAGSGDSMEREGTEAELEIATLAYRTSRAKVERLTINDVLPLDLVLLVQLEELLVHCGAPGVRLQLFDVALKLPHQLTVHHLSTFNAHT